MSKPNGIFSVLSGPLASILLLWSVLWAGWGLLSLWVGPNEGLLHRYSGHSLTPNIVLFCLGALAWGYSKAIHAPHLLQTINYPSRVKDLRFAILFVSGTLLGLVLVFDFYSLINMDGAAMNFSLPGSPDWQFDLFLLAEDMLISGFLLRQRSFLQSGSV